MLVRIKLTGDVLKSFTELAEFNDKNNAGSSCVRDQDATTAAATHIKDMIFKLNQIHASVIYQIP